ncbi:beta-glucosidase family protein [Bogoriella caseilytica]|uniref:Beta-glucosidase/beta-xylosidase n=1 Tax=Bogoriella caseilytica TaxID=56055 RepID=A0A3N2BCV0_9MICO|nr:glycoside hydrolase family 3 N-terminal domain-containing protein [Bogoriella caseilytica]ROR73065.1 beta-glucosidase/beta-xylosidase [Bogoriella caseilytica]
MNQESQVGERPRAATGSDQAPPSRPWQDAGLSTDERVEYLVARMTPQEKVSQLVGLWVGADATDGDVAPHQSDMLGEIDWDEVIADGLGQLTRPFGTVPVDPTKRAAGLARSQREVMAANRFGIPALVHEECLAGFAAWQATAYPVPLSWGASFDPELVARMAQQIGASMRSAGVHQGLAPVLDVVRDYRWGRVEETIGEDPYLIGTLATAYVRGLQSQGIIATLKHFAGYSLSRAARNLAPVSIGPRELADLVLAPFEMAVREGEAGSVMASYTEIDGVPSHADPALLTDLLRERWGFTGTVVADYFGVNFLRTLHGVAADEAEAARLALEACVDVELPTVHCYGQPLLDAIAAGQVDISLVDAPLRRVLRQKIELGLLEADYDPEPPALREAGAASIVFDDEESRGVALELARESVVLLANDGVLPLGRAARVAVVGPRADDAMAMLGCYSFPAHVGVHHPEVEMGIEIPTVAEEIRRAFPDGEVSYAPGCSVDTADTSGFAEAVAAAREAEVAVVAVGDRAGLFGRGTSGEGCDATDLRLPGVQHEFVEAILDTGTPVVLLLITGRPYAVGPLLERSAASLQAFFPGQLGSRAIAEILSGDTNPSGRLPVSLPREPGAQPGTYLTQPLGAKSGVSNIDPTALLPFGHGRSYTEFRWENARVSAPELAVDGEVDVVVTVTNHGDREGTEIVQLYLHDPVAQVTRPTMRLIGYARAPLPAGASAQVRFSVPADVTSFVGRSHDRIVEPGAIELRLARSSADVVAALPVTITGNEREVDHSRRLTVPVQVEPT